MTGLEKLGNYLETYRPDLWEEVSQMGFKDMLARLNKETGLSITPAEFMQGGCEKFGAALVEQEFKQNEPEKAKSYLGPEGLKSIFPAIH